MSDEIDIEEHDVMDNPSIKKIFPDLSVIKKEINQYYDEDAVAEATLEESGQVSVPNPVTKLKESTQESVPNLEATLEESGRESLPISDSKTHLHTDLKNSNEHVSRSNSNVTVSSENPEGLAHSHGNIIILGSKPSGDCQKNKNNNVLMMMIKHEPKIMLQNASPFLNRCKRYCKECFTLFPKTNIYNLHMYNVHTPKGDNYKTSIKRRSNKKNASNENKKGKLTGHACFHCKQLFPTPNSLIEHLYDVLEPKQTGVNNSNTSSKSIEEINKDNKLYLINQKEQTRSESLGEYKNIECSKCALKFASKTEFDEHNWNNHLNYEIDINKENKKIKNMLPVLPRINVQRQTANSIAGKEKKFENNIIENKKYKHKCKSCSEQFRTNGQLQYHYMTVHKKYKNLIKENKINSKRKKISSVSVKTSKRPLFSLYRCLICSKYNTTLKFYSRHVITDHNMKEVPEMKKVLFDPQCKFCSSQMSDMKSYNNHLYKFHKKLMKKAIIPRKNKFNFALKDVLYKCMKCKIHFLSTNLAMSHSKHMKILKNWKCSVCQRVLKYQDKLQHMKQHSFSRTFSVYTLSESALSRILYKCCKCTVHYSEDSYMRHFKKCDLETPDSLYCKVCDILINNNDMDFHERNHKDKKLHSFDFTIIESDMIIDDHCKDKKVSRKKFIRSKSEEELTSKFAMVYCRTCECYISNITMARNVHIEAKCGHMLKTVCKECGLILTMKTHSTHKQVHKKEKFNLYDCLFYDLNTRRQINPPIPEYPSCKMCGVHFLRKNAIQLHICNQQDYIMCNICSIKLTEHAYKLHMPFHNYSIKKVNTEPTEIEDTELAVSPSNDISNNISNSDFRTRVSDSLNVEDITFLYSCKSCQIAVNTYDKVVNHCHDHYDSKHSQINIQKCLNCLIVLDVRDYDNHNKLHLSGKYNKDTITVVDFDPFYFRFNNEFWTKHIFAYVADEQIRKVINNSMYKYECRLKMEELQSGSSSMMLYKCEKCRVFIEPQSLYLHAENSRARSCVKLRKHPCAFCGLSFVSQSYRMAHQKEHEGIDINLKSYNILLFNKTEHETFNKIMFDACNRFVLYQCRNCEAVVDKFQRKGHQCDMSNLKICSSCGLLFHQQDYDLHFIRHEELEKFNAENMIVVMFGKQTYLGKKEVTSTFYGTKYDYTVYKCTNCELCLKTQNCTSEHVCVFGDSKCKCAGCGLYFLKSELKHHSNLHQSNLELDEFNENIISFIPTSTNANVQPQPTETPQENNDSLKVIEKPKEIVKERTKSCSEKIEKIYKCDCGLHFLEELNAQQHANICNIRMKISKQSCFKCDLLFTPGELFNHLLKHHCDKKLQYKFDIVIVSKQDKKPSDSNTTQ